MTATDRLWIENSGLDSNEIRENCTPAEAAIASHGIAIEAAYKASLAECDGQPYDAAALAAWQEAERIALANVAAKRAILALG